MSDSVPHGLPDFLPRDIVFESFTFPFFDFNFHLNHAELVGAFLGTDDRKPNKGKRGIYVHIPFCDTICLFCPFDKSVGDSQEIDVYLRALYREIELVSATPLARSWDIDAIYFGGGTPSVLGAERASRLVHHVKRSFKLKRDVEISFEVEPKSASAELCSAIREAGVNRVSFGVQTLDPALRNMMNLTASHQDIVRTTELSVSNFANTNLDMIVGFPGQTAEHAAKDVHEAACLGIGSISVYPMDYITVLPVVLEKIRKGQIPTPAVGADRWTIFHAARDALRRTLEAQNMYCFGKPHSPKCRYMFEILYGGYDDQCIGLGRGAYTSIRGLIYKNASVERDYVAALDENVLPIQIASPGHAYEKSFVYFPKRLSADLRHATDLGIAEFIRPKVEKLVDAGLVQITESEMELTDAGAAVYAQIMVGFLSDNQRRLYDRASSRLQSSLNWGTDGTIDPGKTVARGLGLGARNAMRRN